MATQRVSGTSERLSLDVGDVGLAGVETLAADLWEPMAAGSLDGLLMCCAPGGGMSRRYWDLRPPGGADSSYSMAEYLARRGATVLLVDPPGVGESPIPEDPWALTPAVLGDMAAAALSSALDGRALQGRRLRPMGLSHSMGGLVTVHQQAKHHSFAALALLGFAGRGMPEAVNAQELAYRPDDDPESAELVRLTRARYDTPLRRGRAPSAEFLMVGAPDPAGRAALADARSALLAVAGLASIIPGATRPQLEAIDVPVFLGVGEHDITGPSHDIPAHFPGSKDVTLFVLPGTGHNHNAATNRAVLWDRLCAWAQNL